MEPFYDWEDLCFLVRFRSVQSTNSGARYHPEIDGIWRSKYILFANIPDDGVLYFKVSVYLNDYNLEFQLSAYNKDTSKWMSPTDTHTVTVQSFLKDNDFQIGECVSFRDEQSSYTSNGVIMEKLNADNYRISDTNGNDHEIDMCRIYQVAIPNEFECNLRNTDSLCKQLLMKRDDETLHVFNAINEAFEELSIDYCVDSYGLMNATTEWEAVSLFVTTNVFGCLYGAQFEYTVDCLVNGMQHGALEMMNIRQHDIKIKYENMKQHKGLNYNATSISWSCDWCRSEMGSWEYGFRCTGCRFEDRHEYCTQCVNTVINLNGELSELLSDLLLDELVCDVIESIVHFVIGRVVVKEIGSNDHMRNNKRKTDGDCCDISSKRRKLNSC